MKNKTLQNIITICTQIWQAKSQVLLLASIIGILASCKSPSDNSFRVDSSDKDQGTFFIDSFSVKISTLRAIDTFTTHGFSRLTSGTFIDPDMGKTTYIPYFEIEPTKEINSFGTNSVLESMNLNLFISYIYGDSSSSSILEVYQLKDSLPDKRVPFFNFEIRSLLPNIKGTANVIPKTGAMIRISLDELGNQLLTIPEFSDPLTSKESFRFYIKGLSIVSKEPSKCVIGFDLSRSTLRMFYKNGNTQKRDSVFFSFLNSSTRRYNTTTPIISSKLSSIQANYDEVSSDVTGERMFLQNGNYLRGRILFPFLRESFAALGQIAITRADIEIKVGKNLNFVPPAQLTLYETLGNGRININNGVRQNIQTDGSPINGVENPIRLIYSPSTRLYTGRITIYTQAMAFGQKPFNSFILSTFPGDDGLFANRLEVFQEDVKLKVHYIKLLNTVTD